MAVTSPEIGQRDTTDPDAPFESPGPAASSRPPEGLGVLAARYGFASAALALWLVSIGNVDVSRMNDLGLVSVLPPATFLALGLLTIGAILAIHRRDPVFVILIHVALLIGFIHVSVAWLYEAPRYSWAWKHVGIVDYIQRTGSVDPGIGVLDVYHNWPSFFGLAALFTELGGFTSAASFAAWTATVVNALYVGALVVAYRSLTDDPRIVWTAVWLFLTANWVGQDYFSPQAFAFFLYLVAIGILLARYSKRPPAAIRRVAERFRLRVVGGAQVLHLVERPGSLATADPVDDEFEASGNKRPEGRSRPMMAVLVILLVAIVTAHPLTPLMLLVAVAGLAVVGVSRSRMTPVLMAVLTAGWMLTGAGPFVARQFRSTVGETGSIGENISGTFLDLSGASGGQTVVSWAGRALVVAVATMAIVGAVRRLRNGVTDLRPFVLVAAPVMLVFGGSYGGEALFRVYLFALPFAAFLAAHAWYPRTDAGRNARSFAVAAAVCVLVLGGFLLAHFGKDRHYHFSADEVAAAEFVFGAAEPGSLIVEGSRNYPSQFVDYEKFVYVPISREPSATHARILADPTGVLGDWLGNPDYPGSYLILTSSQKAEIDATGVMPAGSLHAVERALRASPEFEAVFDSPDAVVFRLAAPDGEESP